MNDTGQYEHDALSVYNETFESKEEHLQCYFYISDVPTLYLVSTNK